MQLRRRKGINYVESRRRGSNVRLVSPRKCGMGRARRISGLERVFTDRSRRGGIFFLGGIRLRAFFRSTEGAGGGDKVRDRSRLVRVLGCVRRRGRVARIYRDICAAARVAFGVEARMDHVLSMSGIVALDRIGRMFRADEGGTELVFRCASQVKFATGRNTRARHLTKGGLRERRVEKGWKRDR